MKKFIPIIAAIIIIAVLILIPADDIEASGSGTSSDPYDSFSVTADDLGTSGTYYIYNGSSVMITSTSSRTMSYVSDGFGLTLSNGTISGTLSTTGTCDITGYSVMNGVNVYFSAHLAVVPALYTLTINTDGGTWQTTDISGTYSEGTTISLPTSNDITKSGYTFSSLYYTSGGTSYYINAGSSYTITRDITFTVYWTTATTYSYVLSFNLMGGTGGPTNMTYSTSETSHTFTIPRATPTRDYFAFLGWSNTDSNTTIDWSSGESITLTSSSPTKTLYAVWQEYVNYRLYYDANGGSGSTSDSMTIAAVHYTFTVSNLTPTRSGYTFLGWADSSSSSTVAYVAGDTITLTSSSPTKTIYAVWEEEIMYTFALNYSANSGTGAPSVQTITTTASSHTFTVSSTIPTRSGYIFLGWADTSDAVAGVYSSGDTITLTSGSPTKTIYAVWEIESYAHTLTYDANGGTGAPSAQTITSGQASHTFTISNTEPTRSGYIFLGWADTSDAAAAAYQPGGSITVGETKTIYAVWTEQGTETHTYVLTFNGNGGSGVPVDMSATGTGLSHTFTIPDMTPVKSGYRFLGWSTTATDTAASYTAGGTITVYAGSTVRLFAIFAEDGAFNFSFDGLIKQIGQMFFGGSTSLAGLAMIVVAWLVIIAVLANMGASPMYSVVPMIPIVIIFSAFGIVSSDITILIVIVCAILSATAVKGVM